MKDNGEIFEIPGVYENQRRQTLTLAFTVYVKCLKYMKLVEFDTKFTHLIWLNSKSHFQFRQLTSMQL
jgi:hypothetical protein